MADLDPATATVEDLAWLPPMVKQGAQADWDAIVTTPDLDRRRRAGAGPAALVLLHARGLSGV